MGARGPKPNPEAPNSRHFYRQERRRRKAQVLPVEAPSMPTWLSKEGKAEWRRQVAQLERLGVLAKIDRAMLALFCTTWSDWLELSGLVKTQGRTITGSMGNLVSNPLVAQRNAAAGKLLALGKQFGFAPGARVTLDVQEPDQGPPEGSVLAFARKR